MEAMRKTIKGKTIKSIISFITCIFNILIYYISFSYQLAIYDLVIYL